jgi:hypothetical protein
MEDNSSINLPPTARDPLGASAPMADGGTAIATGGWGRRGGGPGRRGRGGPRRRRGGDHGRRPGGSHDGVGGAAAMGDEQLQIRSLPLRLLNRRGKRQGKGQGVI